MKIKVLPSAVAAATLILLPFTVAAEAESSEDKPAAPRKAARQQQQAERLARFDTNGDGKLDETERRKARETWQAERSGREPARPGPALGGRMRERAKQFDQDGDGKLNAAFDHRRAPSGPQPPFRVRGCRLRELDE